MPLASAVTAMLSGRVSPREMAVISRKWASGEDAFACREAWLQNLPMLHYAYSAINPVAVKSLMNALGLPSGPLRKPLRDLDPERLAAGIRIVRDLEIDRTYGFSLKAA